MTSTAYGQLLRELKLLRKQPTNIDACPQLLRWLGSGVPEQMYARLKEVGKNLSDDRDIQIALKTIFYEGDNVLDRFVQVGTELHIDQRNVRPYSDRGLRKIAHHLVDANPYLTVQYLFLFSHVEINEVLMQHGYVFHESIKAASLPTLKVNEQTVEYTDTWEEERQDGMVQVLSPLLSFPAEHFGCAIYWDAAAPPVQAFTVTALQPQYQWSVIHGLTETHVELLPIGDIITSLT